MSHDPNHLDPLHPPHHVHETAPLHDPVDEWHDHARDEMPQHAHAEVGNARAIIGIGLSLFMVIVVSCIAVYAYYVWFISKRLREQEVAFGKDSPAVLAVQYKRDSLIRLDKGGSFKVDATLVNPAANYSLSSIKDAIDRTAKDYANAK